MGEWDLFYDVYPCSQQQKIQYKRYVELLLQESMMYNLTALRDEKSILQYHLMDALVLSQYIDMGSISSLADVGTGAGIPGLILKIAFPHMRVCLIEVLGKRRVFLQKVIEALELQNVTVVGMDWRSWLRSCRVPYDMICARASLPPNELIRMFQPSSVVRAARLIYWGSAQWTALNARDACYVRGVYQYSVGERQRQLVQFGLPCESSM